MQIKKEGKEASSENELGKRDGNKFHGYGYKKENTRKGKKGLLLLPCVNSLREN